MRNKIKFALLAFFLAVVLVGPAGAATIHDSVVDIPSTSYSPYYIAYEIYNNTLGINADAVPIYIHNQAVISSTESKNLRVFNGKVNLSGQNVFLLALGSEIAFSGDTCDTAIVAGTTYIIGESTAGAVPSADISIQIYDGPTFCTRNNLNADPVVLTGSAFSIATGAATYVSTGMGTVNVNTGIGTVNLFDALNFNVDANLNPTCTYQPTVQVAYIAQTETSPLTTILRIIPQFTGNQDSVALNAELDTDFDFEQFILGSGNNVISTTEIWGDAFTIVNGQAVAPAMWKAWVADTNTGGYSFTLNSVNTQPGLYVEACDFDEDCSACSTTNDLVWTCTRSNVPIGDFTTGGSSTGYTYLYLENDTDYEMNPTIWTISNATITVSGGTVTTACFAPSGSIGVWFGGLEALVPFVKGDSTTGYETYIKLFNRYTKDAKLYVATFKDGINGPMIISTTQIPGKELIPVQSASNPNGMLQITSADIAAICPTCDMVAGIPVKFLIRVPSQQGVTAFAGTGTITTGDDDDDVTFSGTVGHYNQLDPYIEGIVVSTTPTGQRTIPLEFKSFKNGEYNQ